MTQLRMAASVAALILMLALILLALSYCSERDRLKTAKAQNTVANATGKALDKVAKEAPAIRAEQEEKQRAVDEIQGSDTRLPDGFGADLERVRRGSGERRNP